MLANLDGQAEVLGLQRRSTLPPGSRASSLLRSLPGAWAAARSVRGRHGRRPEQRRRPEVLPRPRLRGRASVRPSFRAHPAQDGVAGQGGTALGRQAGVRVHTRDGAGSRRGERDPRGSRRRPRGALRVQRGQDVERGRHHRNGRQPVGRASGGPRPVLRRDRRSPGAPPRRAGRRCLPGPVEGDRHPRGARDAAVTSRNEAAPTHHAAPPPAHGDLAMLVVRRGHARHDDCWR